MSQNADSFNISFRSSLVVRNLATILCLLVIIFGVAGYFSFLQYKKEATESLADNTRYTSHITTEALKLALWNLDNKQVLQQLDALKASPDFCGARVLDATGEVFVDAGFPYGINDSQLLQMQPITFENPTRDTAEKEHIGLLQLCASTDNLQAKIQGQLLKQFLFFFFITVAVLAACYTSLLILVRPLVRIRAAMSHLADSMQPISDPDLLKQDEIGALSASFNKMTADLARTYRQLTNAKELAEKADQAKSNFLSNMTHELRTPLNSMIGMTRLLMEHDLGYEEREMLGVVLQSSDVLLDIVNDILDISKIEAGEIHIERIGIDIEAVIRKSILTLTPLANKKQLELIYQTDKKPPYIMADPLRLGQIFNNLIGNAIKYTQAGKVMVKLYANPLLEGWVEMHCEIIDTGLGIPEEKLEHIFQKFTQVDVSDTRRFGGTGLGLAITRELVEVMYGTIGVKSDLGKGSNFWFKIAFQTTDTLHQDVRTDTGGNDVVHHTLLPPEHVRMLVAEDHPLNQILIQRLLAKYGFTNVTLEEDGENVLRALERNEYDMVLMDCYMPQPNGYEVTRIIREREKHTGMHLPIIATTANAMIGEEEKCFAAGMDDYIAKPILEQNFVSVLSRWVRFDDEIVEKLKTMEVLHNSAPVNLSILKTFTRGDRGLESQLLEVFFMQSKKDMQNLQEGCVDGVSEKWVEAAHLLKGGAGSIGAETLRQFCEHAQSMEDAPLELRAQLLTAIRKAYDDVRDYLVQLGYTLDSGSK